MKNYSFLFFSISLLLPFASFNYLLADVIPGIEVLLQEDAHLLKGKKIALLTNPTGVDRKLRSTIDLIKALPEVELIRLFAPEHGIRGSFFAGEHVQENIDSLTGVAIVSLYGSTRRPTLKMLNDLDVVLYDIQDVGVRHYTYISSLAYMMEECEKAGVEVWVLDRPNPMGGNLIAGPVMEQEFISFIGIEKIPKVYGLTPGEFALLYRQEHTPTLKLRVIPMRGWQRNRLYGDLNWPWVAPSQNIPHWQSCFYYAMTGVLGELGCISVGLGTPLPFEQIGAPHIDAIALANSLNQQKLPGILFRPTSFTPKYALFEGTLCHGVQLHISDYREVEPEKVCIHLLKTLAQLFTDESIYAASVEKRPASMFMKALGDSTLGKSLAKKGDLEIACQQMQRSIEEYKKKIAPCLLYNR